MNTETLRRDRYRELMKDFMNSGGRLVSMNSNGHPILLKRTKYIFTLSDLKMWIRLSDKWCRYCGIGDAETVDHVIPKAKGGLNSWRNMVGCCVICNDRKRDLLPKEAGMRLSVPPRWFGLV